jgi:hypothetical protein
MTGDYDCTTGTAPRRLVAPTAHQQLGRSQLSGRHSRLTLRFVTPCPPAEQRSRSVAREIGTRLRLPGRRPGEGDEPARPNPGRGCNSPRADGLFSMRAVPAQFSQGIALGTLRASTVLSKRNALRSQEIHERGIDREESDFIVGRGIGRHVDRSSFDQGWDRLARLPGSFWKAARPFLMRSEDHVSEAGIKLDVLQWRRPARRGRCTPFVSPLIINPAVSRRLPRPAA